MRITLIPISGVVGLAIAAVIALVVVAAVANSPKRKLLALLPIGVLVLLVLGGVVAAVRTSLVYQRAAVEQKMQEAVAAEIQTTRAEYRTAYQSQVLDYRGDAGEKVVPENASTDEAPAVEIIEYSPAGLDSDQRLSELPEWVGEPHDFDPNSANQTLVLSSEPWSSVEEADEELYGLLSVHAGHFLSAAYPEAEGWYPTRDMLNQMPLIQDAVHERVPLEIGEHTVYVQHAHWQVKLTPEVREQLFEKWRPTVVQQRLVWLGTGTGVLTLLFAVVAGISRIGRRPRGGVRERAAAVAGIIILLAGISALFSA